MTNTDRAYDVRARHSKVLEYLDANDKPVQELCPELNQYWTNSKGDTVYWNSKSGRRKTCSHGEFINSTGWLGNKDTKIINALAVRKEYEGFYLRYVEELDALEISKVVLAGGRGIDGEKKTWYFASKYDRFLIFYNDPVAYGKYIHADGMYYSKVVDRWIRGMNTSLCDNTSYDEFLKYSRGQMLSSWNGEPSEIIAPWMMSAWYVKYNAARNVSANAKHLENMQLDDVESPFLANVYTIVYQNVDDMLSVLRMFEVGKKNWCYRDSSESIENKNESREILRVYITQKGKVTTIVRRCGMWKLTSKIGYLYCESSCAWANYDEALTWAPLKYVLPALPNNNIKSVIMALRHPIVEQLSKAGFARVAQDMMRNGEIAASLKRNFRVKSEKKLPMYKLLGVNKYILQAANSMETGGLDFVQEMKSLYATFDVSSLDAKTVDMLCKAFDGSRGLTRHLPNRNGYRWWRRSDEVEDVSQSDRDHLLKLFRLNAKDDRFLPLWDDMIRIWANIICKPELDLYNLHGYEDLLRMHDALLALQLTERANREAAYNKQQQQGKERREKVFAKLQEDRLKRFEYENDKFAVRIPKSLEEITMEGIQLSHCVGGYVNDHAVGNTNILFLRRRNEEDHSFYTIEIRGDTVIQIHGKHNRWLGNDPDAVPFMYEYLRQLGVKFDKTMLLNTGAGYSRGATYLPESALYAAVPA